MVAASPYLDLTEAEIEQIFAGDDYELQRQVHLYLTHPLFTFQPRPNNLKEWDEQEAFASSTALFSICLGGNGSGKTEAAAYKTAKYLLSTTPMRPAIPFWIIGQTHELVCGVCWGEKLIKYIPPECIKHIIYRDKRRQWPSSVILWHPDESGRDGWVIEFKSFEEGVDNFQSRSIGGYWFNETAPLSIVLEVQFRCREYDSPGWADFTPLSVQAIEWEEKYLDPPEGWVFYHLNSIKNTAIAKGFMERTLGSLPEDIRNTRQFGMFGSMKGQVYKEWRPNLHLIDPFHIPRDWKKFRGVDFGYNNPFCCLWVARDYDNRWFVYDEHYESQQLHDHHATEIKSREWNTRDPHYGPTYSDHDSQEIAELMVRGIECTLANKSIYKGIEAVRMAMMPDKITNKPRLYVFKSCENLKREIPRYKWPDNMGRKSKGNERNAKELPVDFDNHALDALRYVIASEELKRIDNLPEHYRVVKERSNQSLAVEKVRKVSTGRQATEAELYTGQNHGAGGLRGGNADRDNRDRDRNLVKSGGRYGNLPQ